MSKPEKLSEAELADWKTHARNDYAQDEDTNAYGVLELSRHIEWQAAELAAKDAEIARLREALWPFARVGDISNTDMPRSITCEQWMAAAKALGGG